MTNRQPFREAPNAGRAAPEDAARGALSHAAPPTEEEAILLMLRELSRYQDSLKSVGSA